MIKRVDARIREDRPGLDLNKEHYETRELVEFSDREFTVRPGGLFLEADCPECKSALLDIRRYDYDEERITANRVLYCKNCDEKFWAWSKDFCPPVGADVAIGEGEISDPDLPYTEKSECPRPSCGWSYDLKRVVFIPEHGKWHRVYFCSGCKTAGSEWSADQPELPSRYKNNGSVDA